MSAFATLLNELAEEERVLAKAMKGDNDDKDIAALADGDEDDDGVSDRDDSETYDDDDDDEKDGDKKLAKSLRVTLPDGTEMEAFDGTAMVKALQTQVQALHTDSSEVIGQTVNLLKSFGAQIREQRSEIAALKKSLATLGASGTGRRSATRVVIDDRTAEPSGAPNPETIKADVMAKAMSAYDNHKISGLELATIDVALRKNQVPDQSLLAKIA